MSTGLLCLSDNVIKFEPVTRVTPVFYDETNQEIFAVSGDNVTVYKYVSLFVCLSVSLYVCRSVFL